MATERTRKRSPANAACVSDSPPLITASFIEKVPPTEACLSEISPGLALATGAGSETTSRTTSAAKAASVMSAPAAKLLPVRSSSLDQWLF